MKIGLVCPYDIFRAGGVQEHVLAQAAELRLRGHAVKIITPRVRKHHAKPPVDTLFVGNSTKLKTPIKTTLEVGLTMNRTAIDDLLSKERFDILHIHEPEVPMIGAQIIAKANCPVVATFHAIYPDTAMGRTMESFRVPFARSMFSKLASLTAVSEAAALFVREQTDQPVTIVPNGIDLKKYRSISDESRVQDSELTTPKTILYVGRLEKRKGVRYLLKAYAELMETRSDVALIIAGDGGLRKGLEDFVQSNKLPNVQFLGFVDEESKLKLLKQSTIFCSPALYGESFGIVLLEAMASGAVIVAGNNMGYAGVMKDTGRISLIDPKNTEEFSRRLDLLLDDELLRTVWLDWAAGYIKQFDYVKVVDSYLEIYKKTLTKK